MKAAKPRCLLLIFLLALAVPNIAQEDNLIPNHSFEEFSGVPLGWFYNGSQFSRLVKYWYSPTLASPDVFGPDIIVPKHWQKKGFGKQKPLDGLACIGITVYGCSQGKPHCREYIQIQLNESLVIGQKYELQYWLGHLDNSLFIDGIGALFTMEPIKQNDDKVIGIKPHISSNHVLRPYSDQWNKVKSFFVADSAYNYITIGNFNKDEENEVYRGENKYEFSYYYFDDFELKKVPPFIAQVIPEDDLSKQSLEIGKKIQLKNIYFDLDKSDLLPRSFVELNKLKKILSDNPSMNIEVLGHTDIQGESDYNIELSMQRAKSVTNYLINKGIAASRIDYKGFGSQAPIADNSDEFGRKLNRRVEILITAL